MTNPTLISTPFATAGGKNPIQESVPLEPNSPTWEVGFPAITSTPVSEGGLPPKRLDFNGVLNAITENTVHQTKGLGYEFDATYATKIGGYPLHAVLTLTNGDRVQSTVPNNIIDPNIDMTGWKPSKDKGVITTAESIADLIAIQNPKDGQVVQAKGFYEATNFALAQPYKGGGDFIYVSSKSTVNDGFMCFNGWTRQILDREYNAYMSGCKCDGVTDDTQNFDKIMYWLESNNQGGTVTIDGDLYINSEIEYKGKQQFVHEGGFNNGETIKVGIRLSCSNTTLNITGGSSIKFGLHFHDSNAYFISAVDQKFSGDYLYQGQLKNIRICGGGTIDFTGAGCISTTMKLRRYGVTTGLVDDFDCHDVKFLGGDLANCIANITVFGVDFAGVARKHNIYNCTFKDNFYDLNNISPYQSTSVDHSSVYINAPESSVWNNTFTQKSVWARSMGCAIELHGNNQQFYSNFIVGYCRSVIIAGYKSDQEVPRPELETYIRTGISVTNNISYANYMISVWGRDLRFGTIDIADNIHYGLPKITPAELIEGGGVINPVNYPAFFHIVGDGGITATPNVQVLGGFFIRNNTFNGTFNTGFDEEQFALLANNYINSGLHFIDNKMSCPTQLRVVAGYQMNLYLSSWLRNKHIAPTAQATNKEVFLLNLGFMQSCHIEVDLGFLGFRGSQELCRIDISDDATSVNNTIKINQPMQKWEASLKFLTGNILNKDSNFYLNNSIEYDGVTTVDVTSNLDTGLILSTTSVMPLGVKSVQLKSADVSRAIKFTLPMNYFKDFTGGGSSCSASTLKSDSTETGLGLSITGFAKIIV